MSALAGIMICRPASDPLKPGALLGFECAICLKSLQLTPRGARLARSGELVPLCWICGTAMAKRLENRGHELDVQASSSAMAQAVGKPRTVPEWLRRQFMTCAHCGTTIRLGERHQCPPGAA